MVAGSLPATPMQHLQVKNTFVDFVYEGDNVECGHVSAARAQRQFSAPAGSILRQYSTPLASSQPKLQGVDEDFCDEDFESDETAGKSPARQSSDQDGADEDEMPLIGDSPQRQLTDTRWPSYPQPIAPSPFMMNPPYVQQGAADPMGQAMGFASVPYPSVELADAASTTRMMMCNVPEQYTQSMLVEEINVEGFMGSYDFVHLPFDPETGRNCGYALISFIDAGHASMFSKVFEGRRMSLSDSEKTVSVIAVRHVAEAQSPHKAARENQPSQRGGRRRRGGSLIDRAVKQQQQKALAQQQATAQQHGAQIPADSGAASAVAAAGRSAVVPAAAGRAGSALPRAPAAGGDAAAAGSDAGRKMRFCPFCGGKRHATFKFCEFCGKSLSACETA